MNLSSRYTLIVVAGLLLLLLTGCASRVALQAKDISGRSWVKMVRDGKAVEGFFTSPDGRLKLINSLDASGVSWELHDNLLLLWIRVPGQSMLQPSEYYPLIYDGQLTFSTSPRENLPVYFAVKLQDPANNVHYYPDRLVVPHAEKNEVRGNAYIQFDSADKSFRGYGGVNNFYGHYQREGLTGFKVESISSTKMSGPAMDDELKLMQCLDLADSLISFQKQLFLYRNAKSLCSFRTH